VKLESIGVYPVPESEEPCHLVEWRLSDYEGPFDVGVLVQQMPGQPEDNWQAPWDEHVLSADGTSGELLSGPLVVTGDARFCFFYFYLDPEQPFRTPVGPVLLPPSTERPARLDFVRFEEP